MIAFGNRYFIIGFFMVLALVNTIVYEIIRDILFVTFVPFFRLRGYGVKNVPSNGPVIFLSNHQSFFDPIFCQVLVRRHMYYVARDSLFKNKVLGSFIKYVHAISIRRGTADIGAMRSIIGVLKKNRTVCLFPEGTRSVDGKISQIKPGFSLLTRKTGAMVVPVVIDGAFECWPRDKKWPSLGKVRVSYGEAISAEEIAEMGDKAFSVFLTKKMRQMQDELRKAGGKEAYIYSEDKEL